MKASHVIPAKVFKTIAGSSGHPVIWNKIWLGQNQAEPNQIQMTQFPTTIVYIQSDNDWKFYQEPSLSWEQVADPSTFFFDNPTGPNSYITRP